MVGVIILCCLVTSCYKEKLLTPPPPAPDYSFSEEFDNVPTAFIKGWKATNGSLPLGTGVWEQKAAVPKWFGAYSGSGFIGVDFRSTSATQGIISNWLLSPPTNMQNGDSIIFYTRSLLDYDINIFDSTDYGNRLQVRLNPLNDGTTVGKGIDSGDFTLKLLDINPNYDFFYSGTNSPTAYPAGGWTKFIAIVNGLSKPVKARFAFRYFVEDGGSQGLATGVGIDKVEYRTAPHP